MDHLLYLHEKLDLTNPPTATLQIVAGTNGRSLREMVADASGDLPHFFDDSEVERTSPHEWLDRVQKPLTQREVPGRGARTDEGGALPWESARLIVRNGRVDGESDR